jgi:hypothetical protein
MATGDIILYQNEPNPVNGHTNISFELSSTATISLVISDHTGIPVINLRRNQQLLKGKHTMSVNTSDISAGIYFIILKSQNGSLLVKKMIIL